MFMHKISILEYDVVHLTAGDDKPLPISSRVFAESNSAIFPTKSHNLFCASIGDVSFLCHKPKFSMFPPVANCIAGDKVL